MHLFVPPKTKCSYAVPRPPLCEKCVSMQINRRFAHLNKNVPCHAVNKDQRNKETHEALKLPFVSIKMSSTHFDSSTTEVGIFKTGLIVGSNKQLLHVKPH